MEIPTYRRAPNFSIPPDGPLKLGTIVEDLKELRPLNESERVEVPAESTYRTVDRGFSTTLERAREHGLGVVARILGVDGLGGEAGTRFGRSGTTAVSARELETTFFYPSTAYVAAAMAAHGVRAYAEVTRRRFPVYMITGLKIVRGGGGGASWSSGASAGFAAALEVAVPQPLSGVVDAGPKVEVSRTTETATAVEDADSFVLAYRATKIWYRWFKKDEFKARPYRAGATMAGDDDDDDDGSVPVVLEDGEYQVTRDVGVEDEAAEDVVLVEELTGGIEPSRWVIPT